MCKMTTKAKKKEFLVVEQAGAELTGPYFLAKKRKISGHFLCV